MILMMYGSGIRHLQVAASLKHIERRAGTGTVASIRHLQVAASLKPHTRIRHLQVAASLKQWMFRFLSA